MDYLNNFFYIRDNSKGTVVYETGEYEIKSGIITAKNKYLVGQYIRVMGSILNDGVYIVSDDLITLQNTTDEIFEGTICPLRIPRDFLSLVADIESFEERASKSKNRGTVTSETFAGYSYTVATNSEGLPNTWKDVFADRLSTYRKMYEEEVN